MYTVYPAPPLCVCLNGFNLCLLFLSFPAYLTLSCSPFIFPFNSLTFRVSILVQIPHAVIFFPLILPSFLLLFQFTSIRHALLVSETNAELPKQIYFFSLLYITLSPCVCVSAQVCGSLCLMPGFGVIAVRVLGGSQSRCRWD